MTGDCTHLAEIQDVTPSSTSGCEDCPAHFHATKHPIMRSFERGEDWGWCYLDEVMLEANELTDPRS
jgi:hypothetical protein